MMGQTFESCPLVDIGGTPGEAPEPGPQGARWLGRLFNVARLATMGVQPGDLSAAGVEALVTLDAERARVEREHIERARKG